MCHSVAVVRVMRAHDSVGGWLRRLAGKIPPYGIFHGTCGLDPAVTEATAWQFTCSRGVGYREPICT